MSKLHQIIAVLQGKKARSTKVFTDAYQGWKDNLITGISRTYTPLNEEGEVFPAENKKVQVRVQDVLSTVTTELADFYDCLATQEFGNTLAKANVVVDGTPVLSNVPVGTLLFLEKQLEHMLTFVSSIPTLPTDKEWEFSKDANCYVSTPVEQTKTAKVPTNFVKFQPTDKQPGQSEILYIDKTIGHWTTKNFSGAIPAKEQSELIAKVVKLQEAVKIARETANSTEVEQVKIGKNVLDFIFGKK